VRIVLFRPRLRGRVEGRRRSEGEGGNPLIKLGEASLAHGTLLVRERDGDRFTSRGGQT